MPPCKAGKTGLQSAPYFSMPKTMYKILPLLLLLAACGYKGDLYLPKQDDKNRFGVIQTGITPPENKENPQ